MAAAAGSQGLIDTDILIDAARGVVAAMAFLNGQLALAALHISIISAMELVAGCRNRGELLVVKRFLQTVTVVPVTAAGSRRAIRLMESFSLSHGLEVPDALIAATALTRRRRLYTKIVRHFQMIPSLVVVRPY